MIRQIKTGLCVLLCSAAATWAAAETTQEFLASCETNAKECHDYITGVHLLSMFDPATRDAICLPKDYVAQEVTASIKAWLAAHPEVAAEPPGGPILKAYQALYPNTQACRDTYARADPFPAGTKDFLAYCRAEPSDAAETCRDEIAGVGLMLDLDTPGAICPVEADPADAAAFGEALTARTGAIRGWMAAREDLADRPRRESILAAYKALYAPPCPTR